MKLQRNGLRCLLPVSADIRSMAAVQMCRHGDVGYGMGGQVVGPTKLVRTEVSVR